MENSGNFIFESFMSIYALKRIIFWFRYHSKILCQLIVLENCAFLIFQASRSDMTQSFFHFLATPFLEK